MDEYIPCAANESVEKAFYESDILSARPQFIRTYPLSRPCPYAFAPLCHSHHPS